MKKALRVVQTLRDGQGDPHCRNMLVAEALDGARVAIVTLGCAKNQVDSEVMLGVLQRSGFTCVSDLADADVAIVNTCGFLESAVKEGVDCVLDVAEHKKRGTLRRLLVAGCMVERYKQELVQALPEVDAFLRPDDLLRVAEVVRNGRNELRYTQPGSFLYDHTIPRATADKHWAYVKIAEGCDRTCSFCLIPQLRGPMRRRSLPSIVAEVEGLAQAGAKEVNLVAQDSTAYGPNGELVELLNTLDRQTSIPWIRLLYTFPTGIDEQLLRTLADSPRICDYLDIPLQHSSEKVLRGMSRPLGRFASRSLVDFIRRCAPELQLRTTFIVGFPGETDEDVADLEQFVAEGHFASVGVFTFSREQGTSAADLPGQLPEREKEARRARIMLRQQEAAKSRLAALLGQSVEVLVEGLHEESDLLLKGRARFQAPEVDGAVIINDIAEGAAVPAPGALGRVELTEVAGYDLVGRWHGAL